VNEKFQHLDQEAFIRQKLYGGEESNLRKYAELVVGKFSLWRLLRYEVLTTFLGPLPGALGLLLRKFFYPALFKRAGKGTVFGRNIIVRNGHNICLGERVILDDNCLIDGRGAGDEGVIIGDRVMINRNVAIQAKIGPIAIGSDSDIGADCAIISQGGIYIGEMVSLGGSCHVGGGSFLLDLPNTEQLPDKTVGKASWVGGQHRITRGPIQIGARCAFAGSVTVLDGASVGPGCVVAPGMIIQEDVPADSVVMMHQKQIIIPRAQFGRAKADVAGIAGSSGSAERSAISAPAPNSILDAIYRALDELNEQLPIEKQLKKSPDTFLAEPNGTLDSLGLVNLIVTTERVMEEEFGRTIDLTSQLGASKEERLFESVKTLAHCLNHLMTSDSEP
jgi:acetyltransferase-like isoleucine patch superfamily enzyme/acyl carrier protein